MPLLSLPTELLLRIAFYVSLPSRDEHRRRLRHNLARVILTCRFFHTIMTAFLHSTIASSPNSIIPFGIRHNRPSTISLALRHGAKLEGRLGEEYLAIATELKRTEIVLILLDAGAKPVAVAMRNAIMYDDAAVVARLLAKGFRLSWSVYEGLRPMWWVANCKSSAALRVLLAAGGGLVDEDQPTPLSVAVKLGWVEGVRIMLEWGMSANGRAWAGETLLELARKKRYNNEELVGLLLEYGAVETEKEM